MTKIVKIENYFRACVCCRCTSIELHCFLENFHSDIEKQRAIEIFEDKNTNIICNKCQKILQRKDGCRIMKPFLLRALLKKRNGKTRLLAVAWQFWYYLDAGILSIRKFGVK